MIKINLLKAKRMEAGISQDKMADVLGITRQAYNYKENDPSRFNKLEKKEINRVLKCTIFKED